jgi:hypothetical protein
LGVGYATGVKALTERRLSAILLILFIAVHASYFALGVRFDASPLASFWQNLDVELLRSDLARSLFYLHSQPPLWNLYLGVVLKLFSSHHTAAFAASAIACGFAFYLTLVSLIRRLGAGMVAAVVASTLFMASPSFVLHEQILFYASPLAAALTLSAVLLDEFLRRGRAWTAFAFYATLLFLATSWGLFHLCHLLIVTAGLVALAPDRRRWILGAGLPALVILASLYTKNLVVFGHFEPSTWIGMNVARITVRRLPREARERLIAARILSPVARVRPFAPLDAYPPAYAQATSDTGIACLREALKSTGQPNLNHLAYVAISEQYLRDSLAVVRHEPRAYLRGMAEAWLDYGSSTSDSSFLAPNSDRARLPGEVYDRVVYGRSPGLVLQRGDASYRVYWGLVLALPMAWLFGLRIALSRRQEASGFRILVLYLCFNIAWVAVVGNSMEVGENNRFRFTTDPLTLALLALMLCRAWESARRAAPVRSGAAKPVADNP